MVDGLGMVWFWWVGNDAGDGSVLLDTSNPFTSSQL
jgi:hypothetical protein